MPIDSWQWQNLTTNVKKSSTLSHKTMNMPSSFLLLASFLLIENLHGQSTGSGYIGNTLYQDPNLRVEYVTDINDPKYEDCDWTKPDDNPYILAAADAQYNTAFRETSEQREQRLNGDVPDDNIEQEFDPLEKHAVCFNEPYKTDFSAINQWKLYEDYVRMFDWGFANNMGSPLQALSSNVTNNRFPGMMLRMCFHDNAIHPDLPDFQDYIDGFIEEDKMGWTRWTGPPTNLATSGGDASVLVCSKERFHPNQNYDQTASRVLYALQTKSIPGIVDYEGKATNMVDKYKLSYADLLHNGCVAAAIHLRPKMNRNLRGDDAKTALAQTPMHFGRKDACRYKWADTTRVALCGPTELLPGLAMNTKQLNDWFVNRGMTPCQFMALMWTHTTIDNMGEVYGTCPIMHLPCTLEDEDGEEDTLDYFTKFLQPGTHEVASIEEILDEPEHPNCEWTPYVGKCGEGPPEHWPLTAVDCSLSLDVVSRAVKKNPGDGYLHELKDVVKNFHTEAYPPEKALMCSLRIMGGEGDKDDCADILDASCTDIGTERVPSNHMFGSYYGHP
jgi:Peroxidase